MAYILTMFTVIESATYTAWIDGLGDARAVARIEARVRRMTLGNLGDAKSLGGGVSELRIDYGPGYRVYFTQRHRVVYLLLCGGDKRSQTSDIKRAQRMVADLGKQEH